MCTRINPSPAQPNQADAIGQQIIIPNACGPAGSVSNYASSLIPYNGEYQWAGEVGNCNYCSFAAPSSITCSSGCDGASCCSITGKQGSYTRTQYLGNPTLCCRTQPANGLIADILTCNPIYTNNYSSADCDDYMLAYCGQSNNLVNDPSCMNWINNSLDAGRPIANELMQTYCSQGSNYNSNVCQQWANAVRESRNSPDPGAYNNALSTYCSNNPNDPNCACMEPPQNITQLESLMATSKMCWYAPCHNTSNYNYLTSDMITTLDNCQQTTCYINAGDVTITGGGKVIFQNSCADQYLKNRGVTGGEEEENEEENIEEEGEHVIPNPSEETLLQKLMSKPFILSSSLLLYCCFFIICIIAILGIFII